MTQPSLIAGTVTTAFDGNRSSGEGALTSAVTIHADAKILIVKAGTQKNTTGAVVSTVTIDLPGGPISLTKLVDARYVPSGGQAESSLWYITSDDAAWDTGAYTVSVTPAIWNGTLEFITEQHQDVDPADPWRGAGVGATWNGTLSALPLLAIDSDSEDEIVSSATFYNVDPISQTGVETAYIDNGASYMSLEAQNQDGVGIADAVGLTLSAGTSEWTIVAGSLKGVGGGGGGGRARLKAFNFRSLIA